MEYWVKTEPTSEPLSLDEVKNWLKLSGVPVTSEEDDLIEMMIKAARRACEEYTGLSIAEKTYIAQWEFEDKTDFNKILCLPMSPISSITSVYAVDIEGTETELTLNSSYYVTGYYDKKIRVDVQGTLAVGVEYFEASIRCEYVAGYGSNTIDLPEQIKIAMLKCIAEWYDHRTDFVPVLSSTVKRILDTEKIISYL